MGTSKTYLTSAVLAAAFGLPTERGTTERRSNSPQSVHREKLKGRAFRKPEKWTIRFSSRRKQPAGP